MEERRDFGVTINKKEVVAAMLPMEEHLLQPSNLDLLLPPLEVGVYFCYRSPTSSDHRTFGSTVSALKKSLAQALTTFHPFAGEVVVNSVGEVELLCNNRGVDFFEASADLELHRFNFYNPQETIEGKLLPKKIRGVLSVQVTKLKCGGMVVGCSFDHRIADSYSANMFFISWSETARSLPISTFPIFRLSLLSPRRPGGDIDPSIDHMYAPISTLAPPKPQVDVTISRLYYVTADQLTRLQSLANSNRTKLESFSAFLWTSLAKSSTVQNEINLGIIVDGRTILSSERMGSYFGNVISIPFGTKRADELTEKPFSWVVDQVHAFLKGAKTKEHFLGLVDWVEACRPEPALSRIYAGEGPGLVVSSGQRFPMYEVDFGWGKPVFGSYHFDWGVSTGYVMPMPSPVRDGDWVVFMHLAKAHEFESLEMQTAGVLHPLTADYIFT